MLAAVTLAFTACTQKEETSINLANEKHYATFTLGKDVETKTTVVEGTASTSYKWCEEDTQYLHVYENGTEGEITDFELNDDQTVATLTVAFGGTSSSSYKYKATYGKNFTDKDMPILQTDQYPTTESFDPAADILVSREIVLEARASSLSFSMGRPVTVNKLTLSGLGEDEIVSSVALTMDKNIAGTLKLSSNAYTFTSESNRLTMKYDATTGVISEGSFPVYFVSAPVEDASIVSVVVVTDKKVYVKSNSLDPNPFEGKPALTFATGSMTRFAMNMSGFGAVGTQYTLVQSEDQIFSGATYLIGAEGYVMGDDDKNRTTNIGAITAPEGNGNIMITASIPAYTFSIESVDNGYTIQDNATSQYLYASSTSSNQLKETDDANDARIAWTISIDNGVASINNVENTSRGQMRFNPNSGSPLFACYASSASTGTNQLALYIDESTAVEPTDPELAFNPSSVSVYWDDKDNFEAPALSKPEGITVTWASSKESVATIDEESGEITFVGNGTTTITASSPKTKIGNVIYKADNASYELTVSGKPAEKGTTPETAFTVTEALNVIGALEDNGATPDSVYVEGIISEVLEFNSSYKSISYNITIDGNTTSNALYVYSGKGLNGANFTSINNLSVGDEVVIKGLLKKFVKNNVTTPEFTSGSKLYSIIKAPYFSATLDANAIGHAGGDLTLTIAANTAWMVSIDGEATLQIGTDAASTSVSGDSDAVVTVHIPTNTSPAEVIYNITFAPTGVTAPDALTITQSAHGENPKGSEENPYTPSEAYEAATTPAVPNVYVKGIVSAITTPFSSQHGNVTYTLSDDGTTNGNQFTVYRGTADDANTVAVGDGMIVKGSLINFIKNNVSTPEFEAGAVIQSKLRMPAFTSGEIGFTTSTTVTLSAETGATIYYTTDGTDPTTESGVYSTSLDITETTTVKAIAVKDGLVTGIASKTFTKAISNPVTFTQPTQNGCSFTVSVGGENITSGTMVPQNTVVTLTATAGTGYSFSGWTVTGATMSGNTATATFTMGTSAVSISATFTELAIYTFTKYSGAITEGDYLIVYSNRAMNTTVSNNRLQYVEVTPSNDVITTTSTNIVWHIKASGDYWTIYNEEAGKYAAGNGTKNQAALYTDGTDTGSLWTVTGSETYEFVNKKNSDAKVNCNLRNNGTYGFACYATSTGDALTLYKKN